jgi:hypothetical protein
LRRSGAVKAATQAIELLKDRNVLAWDISVPDEKSGGGKRSDPASDKINMCSVLLGRSLVCHKSPFQQLRSWCCVSTI